MRVPCRKLEGSEGCEVTRAVEGKIGRLFSASVTWFRCSIGASFRVEAFGKASSPTCVRGLWWIYDGQRVFRDVYCMMGKCLITSCK